MDHYLYSYALQVGYRMSEEYLTKGDYYPESAWGSEGQIYPSLMGHALLELYKVEKNEVFLKAVRSIIERNIDKQMNSGGWPLSLGATANGIKFEVTPHIMEMTSSCEDLPPTVTALRLLADYYTYTSDESYISSLNKGFEYLLKFWNEEQGIFEEMLKGEALGLRANPKNYQIYAYQCMESISHINPEGQKYLTPLYQTIKQIFEAMDADTYPLLYALYASLIIQKEGGSNYVKSEIKKRIIDEIAIGSRFRIPNVPGAIGHRDGLRGICLDEGHLRNAIGLALVMKFYDLYVEPDYFTKSDFYSEVERWILQMYENGRFFEFIDLKTNVKQGVGTPGQYLPIIWILRKI